MQEQHRSQLIWRHLRVIYNSYAIVSYLACWQFCAIRTARLSVQSSSQELQARVPTGLVSARRGFRALLHTTMPCVARLRPWNEPVESIPLPTLPYLGFHPATIAMMDYYHLSEYSSPGLSTSHVPRSCGLYPCKGPIKQMNHQ